MSRSRTTILSLSLLTLALGFTVQVVIAAKLGTGREMDVYLMAITLPTIFAVLCVSVIPLALVPLFREKLVPVGNEELRRLFGGVSGWVAAIALALAAALVLAAEPIARLLAPGFDDQAVRLTAGLLRVMLVGSLFDALRGVQSAAFYAQERFFLPQLAPSLNHLVMLASAIWLLGPLGLVGLALGWAAGSILMVATLVPGIARSHLLSTELLRLRTEALRPLRLLVPVLLATLLGQATPVIDRLVASTLPAGAISFLGYGSKMLEILMRTAPMAIALAAFPRLSGDAAGSSWPRFRETLDSGVRQVALSALPLAVLVALVRQPLVKALFQRGAFDEAATTGVALAVGWYAVAFVPAAAAYFLSHALYATRSAWTLVRVGLLTVLVNVVLDLVLARALGYSGIAVAFVAVSLLLLLCLVLTLQRRHAALAWAGALRAAGQAALATVPMAALIAVLRPVLLPPAATGVHLWGGLVVIAAAGLAVYALALLALGNREARILAAMLRS